MHPDQNQQPAPAGPASLPPVQGAMFQPPAAQASGQPVPGVGQVHAGQPAAAGAPNVAAAPSAVVAGPGPVDQLKLLMQQYGANPYAFSAAFQQLKGQYLADRYHIVPSTDKN